MKPTALIILAVTLSITGGVRAEEEAPPAAAAESGDPEVKAQAEACLNCHGDPDLSLTLKNGDEVSLYVDPESLPKSVHAGEVACTACHPDMEGGEEGHRKQRPGATARDFPIKYSESCRKCHRDAHESMKGSVHDEALKKGNLQAAVCSDCHGSHHVTKPGEPRSAISQTCAKCHPKVAETYSQSVHGKAVLGAGNPDAPTCTDCHRAHELPSPKRGDVRVLTPELCGRCHADKEKMKKYGLSTNVLQTYLDDFHGKTAKLQKSERDPRLVVALCTDCHGVHDIAKVKDPNSRVLKENLLETCRKCHPDATTNFPGAWMSHYEPSPTKAPLVFAVQIFYKILVPLMISGLILQIALHFIRSRIKR